MNAPGVATQSYSRYRVLPSRQIMTTVPRCLCVPTTPLDLIHRMLLKMLCRTSNARWRMAALVPNGTHGPSFSEAPTKVPGTAYRLITSRCSSGTSTILYAVDGGAGIVRVVTDIFACLLRPEAIVQLTPLQSHTPPLAGCEPLCISPPPQLTARPGTERL